MAPILNFPSAMEKARRRSKEFQRLTPDVRIKQIMDLIEAGLLLIRESPNRAVIQRQQQEREAQWQRIQTELFHQHAR